VFSKAETM